MKSVGKAIAISLCLLLSSYIVAQCSPGQNPCPTPVPRVLKFNGELRDASGNPRTGVIGVMFSIYADSNGGAPLWQETQNVKLNAQGRYAVLLGSNTAQGVPPEFFRSGEPRWLAAQALLPGENEQPRVMLVSVPYALKAADAETLGGLPASAFLRSPVAAGAEIQPPAYAAAAKSIAETTRGAPGATPLAPTLQNFGDIFFADQYPDGVPGALAACPSDGCTIYAGAAAVNRNLGRIDPGTKVVTIYLGPYTYNVTQITLRKSLRIIGMGASHPRGTILQSVNGNDPVFVIPQVNGEYAMSVRLSGLRIIGSVGNTKEDAFFLDASSLYNAGLWYSEFNDLYIYNFAGSGLHLRGPNSNFGAVNQWLTFENVVVFRTTGGGNALRIEGGNFQLHFTDCEFDGQGIGDGTNIYIGGLPGGIYAFPFDITFRGLVSQTAAVAVQLDGAETITFQTSHHESLLGAYLITGNNGIVTRGVSIVDSVFNPNVGVNNGAGYLLNVATSYAIGVYFQHNRLGGVLAVSAPDSVVTATNLSQVVYQDNQYLGSLNVPPTSGITTQISAASTISIGGAHTIGINSNQLGVPITTIQSSLGPGETVTFSVLGAGSVTFAAGGNIGLPGNVTVGVGGTITFVRNDLTGTQNQWWPVSQWGAAQTPGSRNFSLSPGPVSSATLNPGQTATFNLTLASLAGFSGPVAFACAGAPLASTCNFSPNPASLSGNSRMTVTVTVATTSNIRRFGALSHHLSTLSFSPLVLPQLGMLMLIPLGTPRRPRPRTPGKIGLLAGTLLLIIFSVGCSAIGAGSDNQPLGPATPGGTYTLVVTGASGVVKQTVLLTLTVLQV